MFGHFNTWRRAQDLISHDAMITNICERSKCCGTILKDPEDSCRVDLGFLRLNVKGTIEDVGTIQFWVDDEVEALVCFRVKQSGGLRPMTRAEIAAALLATGSEAKQ